MREISPDKHTEMRAKFILSGLMNKGQWLVTWRPYMHNATRTRRYRMSRDVPYDTHAVCDTCGNVGAFDFMGDYICAECLEETDIEEEDE